ncbi:MAG: hypothetical protein KZQ66_20480, partial [Candidatus Thiodiazotropha sp. (ex Lucinoma aequizonata)]|nr:hypothetical protein [Candidatus Thiodiazotropha sp. (ex Lucinoma aequizonata)]
CQLNNVILSHRGVSPINGCFDASQRQIIQIHRFYSIPQTPDSVITPRLPVEGGNWNQIQRRC